MPSNNTEVTKILQEQEAKVVNDDKNEEEKLIGNKRSADETADCNKRFRSDTPTSSTSSNEPVQSGKKPKQKPNQKFIYGNYNRYYGYRQNDPRIDIFQKHESYFNDKDILDIGCHTGVLTVQVAGKLNPKKIDAIDIDASLINQAKKFLASEIKKTGKLLPIFYVSGNYVLKNDALLNIETEKYDTIMCMSVTKWIQLNFGDDGLNMAFKRMYRQLRSGGHLILEAQPYAGYNKRKNLTQEICENYKNIKLLPEKYEEYLLSENIGFKSVELWNEASANGKGFKRPIQVFLK